MNSCLICLREVDPRLHEVVDVRWGSLREHIHKSCWKRWRSGRGPGPGEEREGMGARVTIRIRQKDCAFLEGLRASAKPDKNLTIGEIIAMKIERFVEENVNKPIGEVLKNEGLVSDESPGKTINLLCLCGSDSAKCQVLSDDCEQCFWYGGYDEGE